MKGILPLILPLLVMFSVTATAFADEREITVEIDGKQLEFDVPPQIINDRTMVPMRKIFETLGAQVQRVQEEQGIIATRGSTIIVMKLGAPRIIIADILQGTERVVELDVSPVALDGRTLVPIRAVSEALGVRVDWIGETWTVVLSSTPAEAQPTPAD